MKDIFHSRFSIRAQMLVLVLSVFLPAVAIFAWHVVQELRAAREGAYDRVQRLADETAARLGEIIRDNEAVLGRLAARPLIKAFDEKNCDPILGGYVSLHPEFSTLALRDRYANVICTLIPDPPPAQVVKATPWFQETMRRGKFTVGDASIMPVVGRWVSISAFPVQESPGNVSGVVFFSLNLLKLNQHLFRSLPNNALVEVIDRQNRFLLRSLDAEKWIGQPLRAEDADAVRGQHEGYFSRQGPDGVHRLYAYVTVPGADWRVFAGLPEDQVLAASRAWLARSIVIGLAILLLALALAWRIGSAVISPIDELARASARIADGEISARAQVVGPTEIQVVGRQFNRMLDMRERAQAELVQSEARFRTVADYTYDWEYWQGPQREIIYMSPSCERVTGYSREEFLADPGLLTRITHRDDFHLMAAHFSTAAMLEQTATADYRIVRRDGEIRWIAHACQAVYAPDGQSMGRRVSNRDITERKRAEDARGQLEAQLRESQKMEAIGTLAGGIAHDFNNIIAIILGNAELMRQDASDDPQALESLEEIRKAGSRARDLVQQILAFSRRQPTERKLTALAPVVEESVRMLRATLPARLVLDVQCDADVPAVMANSTQIQQVVINLATNAMQAIRSGPGRIGIRLDTVMLDAALVEARPALRALHEKHPGRAVRLAVSDDGPGMDEETRGRIFEPFFTTKPVNEGTGLGLSVVHGIVLAHEGAIVVDSAPGKGATFMLYLPVVQAQSHAPAPDQNASAVGTTTAALRLDIGRRILYLDDDDALVLLVERLLERRGYRVSGYVDQGKALAALRADPAGFDLVVTDYNMPGMSGLDVAREVRTIRADLPVAVASGFIDEELRAQAAEAGVRELIFKATAVEEFCQAVQRLSQAVSEKSKSS